MKTIKEWLDQLPQPQRHEAINNVINQRGVKHLYFTYELLSEALVDAFNWSLSPEGADYWSNVCINIADCNILLNKIKKDENNN